MPKQYIKNFEKFLQTAYDSMKAVDLEYLEIQKKELDERRPLPARALKSLEEKLEIDEVHNSTAIEGNTLTLGETGLVLTKGITVGGKSLKDHLEVKGYDRAYKHIKIIYDKIKKIDENVILEIHKLIFADFTDDLKKQFNHGIGVYRREPVFIKGSSYVPPNYVKVPEMMDSLIAFLNSLKNDPVRIAVLAHLGLVTVHPFVDGNGRCARLLANLILLQAGYPIVIVKNNRRADYLNALEDVQNNPEDKKIFNLMLEFLQENFNLYKELY
ncbi:Fic family protein [Candidatus Parcubacteria bacterium]|nr:Fic family protein [Candidatus Parcubacteria bacterium]